MLSADLVGGAARSGVGRERQADARAIASSCSTPNPAARELLDPLLEELRRQSRIDQPSEIVRIDGRVKARGDYPLEPKMRVSDLLRAGGGLQDAAYGAKAELTRYRISGDVRADAARRNRSRRDPEAAIDRADLLLQPFDFLNVKEVPEWSEQEQVTLLGEVRFPGIYPIQRGETLRSVLDRAGGLTSLAFPGRLGVHAQGTARTRTAADRPARRASAERSRGDGACRPRRPTRARPVRR